MYDEWREVFPWAMACSQGVIGMFEGPESDTHDVPKTQYELQGVNNAVGYDNTGLMEDSAKVWVY